MLEIGALSDLRAYFVNEFDVLMNILIEELSNHLYLKTHYCDTRWVAYKPGQTKLPIPKDSVTSRDDEEPERRSSIGNIDPSNPRLSRFLQDLSAKPARDPILNLSDDELVNLPAIPSRGASRYLSAFGVPGAAETSVGDLEEMQNNSVASDPETDSFAYMEMVMEALAILGRLGPALEILGQRIAAELFHLVEITIDEVADR